MSLTHYKDYPYSTDGARIAAMLKNWDARCSITGIELWASRGRTRGGSPPKFMVFMPPQYRHGPFRNWRFGLSAWSLQEAIDLANADKRFEKFCTRVWRREFNALIAD